MKFSEFVINSPIEDTSYAKNVYQENKTYYTTKQTKYWTDMSKQFKT